MDGLVQSDKGREQLKMLADTLVERQVKSGPREGSFHAKPDNTFYYDYTAPLALIAAAQAPGTMNFDKDIYLSSVKAWLKHSYQNQDKSGKLRPFGIGEANVANAEAAAGVAWVAVSYKNAIDKREDKGELSAIAESDPKALDTMVDRSLTALATAQGRRDDGLIESAEEWPFAYYTADAHIHAALSKTMEGYPKDSEQYKRAKAIDDKLVSGMKQFLANSEKNGHIPFQKGHETTNFVQSEGHEVIVDAYAGALHGKNKRTDALKIQFEKIMGDPKAKAKFLEVQTVPSSVPMALMASGYDSIIVNSKQVPLAEVMEEQIAALQENAPTEFVHKISLATLTAHQGATWLPPLERDAKAPIHIAQAQPAPFAAHEMDAALAQAMDEFVQRAGKDKPVPVKPLTVDETFTQAMDDFVQLAAKDKPPTVDEAFTKAMDEFVRDATKAKSLQASPTELSEGGAGAIPSKPKVKQR